MSGILSTVFNEYTTVFDVLSTLRTTKEYTSPTVELEGTPKPRGVFWTWTLRPYDGGPLPYRTSERSKYLPSPFMTSRTPIDGTSSLFDNSLVPRSIEVFFSLHGQVRSGNVCLYLCKCLTHLVSV